MKTIFTLVIQFLAVGIACSQGLPLPYSTGFDSAPQQAGWQQFRTGNDPGAYSWSYAGSGFSAPNCVSHDYNVGGGNTDTVVDWFVSPALNFTPAAMSIKVRTSGFSTPFNDSFEVLFSSTDADPSTGNYTVVANLSFMAPQYQWLDTTISLPFTADSGYVALKYKTIGAAWSTYAFDNISIIPALSIEPPTADPVGISIFPNPASASVFISADEQHEADIIKIMDVTGKEIMRAAATGYLTMINTSSLANGIYFIGLMKENSTIATRRFVISK